MRRIWLLGAALTLALGCGGGASDSDAGDREGAAAMPVPEPGSPPAAEPAPTVPAAVAQPGNSAGAPSPTPPSPTVAPRTPASSGAVSPQQGIATDSAGSILQRAAAKYATIRSLQADFTMTYENPLLRSRSTGTGQLYQQRPDRLLLRFSEPAGDVIMSDGRYFWVYYPSIDAEQVIRSPAAAGGSSGVDLQAQFLGDPTERFQYSLTAQEAVAGRTAWVFDLIPRERLGYRRLRVWIDRRDLLARRFEITEDNGSIRRFDLRDLRVNPALPASLFQFTPPAGARVITR